VEICLETENPDEIKQKINEYLADYIDSPTVLRKTREILMRIWVYSDGINESVIPIRKKALSIYRTCSEKERLALHWAMLLLAFPIFKDLCQIIGKLAELQEEISLAQVKRRVYELWGERTTLEHSLSKNIKTLKDCGILTQLKPGLYRINRRQITNPAIINLMISAVMRTNDKLYYSLSTINRLKELFPFEYHVDSMMINESQEFKLDRIGGEPVVGI
jgi:hypothetical protein